MPADGHAANRVRTPMSSVIAARRGRFPGTRLGRALLTPWAALYRSVVGIRGMAYDRGWISTVQAAIPIVSVGNLTVGGTGKTPMVRWLVEELRRRGEAPAVIHGGYAADEPALHRQWYPDVPVYAQRDRAESVARAAGDGASVAVLDDGFQHRRLGRDIDLVLISAERWEGPHRLLPLGPWREPATALGRADAVLVTRKIAPPELAAGVARTVTERTDRPTIRVAIRPAGWIDTGGGAREDAPEGVAVAGIAWPEAFFENARIAGATLVDRLTYPDHHDYAAADVERILQRSRGGAVITTGKDAVKLAGLMDHDALWILEQEVTIEENAAALARLLDEGLA